MRKIILSALFCINLFATSLLTYNVYQREDRLDIVLGFDSPYMGQIIQKPYNIPFYTLTFNDLVYDGIVDKNLNATLADNMQISSKGNQTFITFKSSKTLDMNAVFLDKEKFSIRVRLSPKDNLASQVVSNNSLNDLSKKPNIEQSLNFNQKESDVNTKYIIVVGILCALILILLFLKKKISQNGGKIFQINNKNLNIKYERYLDKNNRFMVLEYEKQSYVVIVGNTNLLLDKKGISSPSENFEAYFEQNKAKIQNMLSLRANEMNNRKSSLNSYKDRLDSEILK